MTTAIYFDLDGTLVHRTRSYDALLDVVFEAELGHTSTALREAYEERFFAAFEACEPEPVRRGMAAAVETVGVDADPEALVGALQRAEQTHSTVAPGTRESLAALAERNRLGVLTNGVPEWQRAKLAHHDLLSPFEAVVASYEVGAHKPDPAVFEAARERLDARQFVMVGDDYEADVEGARAAGFVPVHVEASPGEDWDPEGEEMPGFWATLRAMV